MTASADVQAETPAAYERRMRLFDSLAQQPWAHDFFALLREVDALGNGNPRLGTALRPGAEAVRLGQDPELDFAPAAVMSFRADAQRPPRIGVRFFGLFGPMGPLPLHFTEYARDRQRNHGDPTFARFTDIFHHRALLLFYRAWAQCQPTVQADRPADDQFAKWVSALFGQAPQAFRGADNVPDVAKRFVAGHLARPTRNAESISKVLRQYFNVPIRVQPHVGHWLALRAEDCTRLGRPGARRSAPLGVSAVAGSRVWDRQYKLRLHIGPLSLEQYLAVPARPAHAERAARLDAPVGRLRHGVGRVACTSRAPRSRACRSGAARPPHAHSAGPPGWGRVAEAAASTRTLTAVTFV